MMEILRMWWNGELYTLEQTPIVCGLAVGLFITCCMLWCVVEDIIEERGRTFEKENSTNNRGIKRIR
jgi:hypothetical protein